MISEPSKIERGRGWTSRQVERPAVDVKPPAAPPKIPDPTKPEKGLSFGRVKRPAKDACRGASLGDIYRDEDGNLWRTVGLIDRPAAIIERVGTDERETHVIGSPLFRRFTRLVPE